MNEKTDNKTNGKRKEKPTEIINQLVKEKVNESPKEQRPTIIILGLGLFGFELVKHFFTKWRVVTVDTDRERIAACRDVFPRVEYIEGAADSTVTWRKTDLDNCKYIISTVKDPDINLEICHILREKLLLKIPIIIMVYGEGEEERFQKFDATAINPLAPGTQAVLKKVEKNVTHALNVGLGKGELIEVSIKARSHLVGRKLKYLRPSRWHISAIYREDNLILPTGNCVLKVGDRALLVGDPKVLENVTAILLKGLPQFPLQFGTDIVFPLHTDFIVHMEEAIYWLNHVNAQRLHFLPFRGQMPRDIGEKIKRDVDPFDIGPPVELFKEIFQLSIDTGMLVVPMEGKWLQNRRIRQTFKNSHAPFLLARLDFPYEGVEVLLNGPAPTQVMETGLEIARLLDIPIKAVYVTLPKEMRGREEDSRLRLRRQTVSDFESIYKMSIPYTVLEGNPVRETLKYLAPIEKHLLVAAANPNDSLSFFKPNVTYLVAKSTHLSTLVIPQTQTDE